MNRIERDIGPIGPIGPILLRQDTGIVVCGVSKPAADGPNQLRVELGDAVLDRKSLGPAAVDKLPRSDPKLTGEVLYFDAFLGHGAILSTSTPIGEGLPPFQRAYPDPFGVGRKFGYRATIGARLKIKR